MSDGFCHWALECVWCVAWFVLCVCALLRISVACRSVQCFVCITCCVCVCLFFFVMCVLGPFVCPPLFLYMSVVLAAFVLCLCVALWRLSTTKRQFARLRWATLVFSVAVRSLGFASALANVLQDCHTGTPRHRGPRMWRPAHSKKQIVGF